MKSNIQLRRVEYMPKELEAGTLYVSERFQVAAHLCPCGCGTKVVTPLGGTEWVFSERNGKATLRPSIGNWQIPCRSHYWITDGEIQWSYPWTEEQVEAGRREEQERREQYFKDSSASQKKSIFRRIADWLRRKK